MLDKYTLAASGEQLTQLDDAALAAIVGGDGPWTRILTEIGTTLWECLKTGLDEVISAAQEGYGDARES